MGCQVINITGPSQLILKAYKYKLFNQSDAYFGPQYEVRNLHNLTFFQILVNCLGFLSFFFLNNSFFLQELKIFAFMTY